MEETTNKTYPSVSVVMPAYNMARYLQESVPSVLQQDYPAFELILIDDGSTDSTRQVVEAFRSDKIEYVRRRHDYMASMNDGIARAAGKYIARMDADDLMCAGRLRKQVDFMEAHSGIDVCGGAVEHFGAASGRTGPLSDHRSIAAALLLKNCLAHPSVMMRKSSIDAYRQRRGRLYDPAYMYAEDYRLWTCLVMEGYRLANLPDLLVKHRVSSQSATVRYAQLSRQAAMAVRKLYLKYVVQKLYSEESAFFSGIIDQIMKTSARGGLDLQDVTRLVYVLYKKSLDRI